MTIDLSAQLARLVRVSRAVAPVVSVYLNTRWADEHQRDRVRVFLKTQIRRVREGEGGSALESSLEWIEAQGAALVDQSHLPEAHGVALFACEDPRLREVVPVRTPFEETFVVGDAPHLRPLAASWQALPFTLVAFVDTESARLIPLAPDGAGDELTLEHAVPGRHRRGGWAQLAQSRYQRHINESRNRHLDAVADVLTDLTEQSGVARIILAGEPKALAAFRGRVPSRVAQQIVATVPAARYEAASLILERAADAVRQLADQEASGAAALMLTEAAKGGKAVAGVEETLEAATRGAVHRLFLLEGFREIGGACAGCEALQPVAGSTCRRCGKATAPTELGNAVIARVVATGGAVTTLEAHDGLARAGGVGALLRYPL